jgi:RNase P/RNase MRP subunit p29
VILLGKSVTVTASENRSLVGLKGVVVEDARNSLLIREASGAEKLVLKDAATIKVEGEAGANHELGPNELKGTHTQRLKR